MRNVSVRAIVVGLCLASIVCGPRLCHAAPKTKAKKTSRPSKKPKRLPTIAILPFHCRAAREYKPLSAAIGLVAATTIKQAGRGSAIDRIHLDKVLGEKELAEADLSDNAKLAARGQALGADYVIAGWYDVIEGKLVIRGEVIPSASGKDFGKVHDPSAVRDFRRVSAEGKLSDTIGVIEQFAGQLTEALPKGPSSAAGTVSAARAWSKDSVIAVFDFAATPSSAENGLLSGALSDMLAVAMQEVLPFRMVERQQVRAILQEKKLRMAGLTDHSRAAEIGKLIGADYLLVGGVLHFGGVVRLDLQVLDVASGAVILTQSASGKYEQLLAMHRDLAVGVGRRLEAGLDRLQRLKNRRTGRSPEAAVQAWRAADLARYGSERGSLREARRLAKLALDLDANSALVQRMAGWVSWESGDLDLAEERFRKAVTTAPNDPSCNADLADFLRNDRKSAKQALPFAREAVRMTPESVPAPRVYLAECLLDLGSYEEARKFSLDATTVSLTWRERPVLVMAQAFEKQGRLAESAEWYLKCALSVDLMPRIREYTGKAYRLYTQAGMTDKAMGVLAKRVEFGAGTPGDSVTLAKYLVARDPDRAAGLCYSLLSDGAQPYAREAGELLKEMGRPLEPPLSLVPMFDLQGMRDMGVQALLVHYEGFKFPDRLSYMRRYVEDATGIPLKIAEKARPLVAGDYKRTTGHLFASRLTVDDLEEARRRAGSLHVVGLMSAPYMEDRGNVGHETQGGRWGPPFRCALLSTHAFEIMRPPEHLAEAYSVGCVQKRVAKFLSMLCIEGKRWNTKCAGNRCVFGTGRIFGPWTLEDIPCKDCRNIVQDSKRFWPVGKKPHTAIHAGPETAAIETPPGKPVLLIPVGWTAEQAKLPGIAKLIRTSLGLTSRIHSPLEPPKDRGEAYDLSEYVLNRHGGVVGYVPLKAIHSLHSLYNALPAGVQQDITPGRKYAAVCIISNQEGFEPGARAAWRLWPGDAKGSAPVLILTTKFLPAQLLRTETLVAGDGSDAPAERVPAYAKVILGALAVAARKDHACWTYGCPSTVYENIGIPHRCSPWLCKPCRQAVATYYGDKADAAKPTETKE